MSVGILAFRAEEDVLRVPKRSVDLIGAEGSLLSSWLLRGCLVPSIAHRRCCEDEEVGLLNRVLVTVASRPCPRGNRLWIAKVASQSTACVWRTQLHSQENAPLRTTASFCVRCASMGKAFFSSFFETFERPVHSTQAILHIDHKRDQENTRTGERALCKQ